jgi:hypothetical protein
MYATSMWITELIMICCMCYTLSWLMTVTSEMVKPVDVQTSLPVVISIRDYPRQQTAVDTLVSRTGDTTTRL